VSRRTRESELIKWMLGEGNKMRWKTKRREGVKKTVR